MTTLRYKVEDAEDARFERLLDAWDEQARAKRLSYEIEEARLERRHAEWNERECAEAARRDRQQQHPMSTATKIVCAALWLAVMGAIALNGTAAGGLFGFAALWLLAAISRPAGAR